MRRRVLCVLLLVFSVAATAEETQKHSRSRRGLACMVNPFMCRQRCNMLYPGSTGFCMGLRCRCIGGPFGAMTPFNPMMNPMMMMMNPLMMMG
ncbi:longicornsin-like [Amblyomma americanum]